MKTVVRLVPYMGYFDNKKYRHKYCPKELPNTIFIYFDRSKAEVSFSL